MQWQERINQLCQGRAEKRKKKKNSTMSKESYTSTRQRGDSAAYPHLIAWCVPAFVASFEPYLQLFVCAPKIE
jgi:hypothetical protein